MPEDEEEKGGTISSADGLGISYWMGLPGLGCTFISYPILVALFFSWLESTKSENDLFWILPIAWLKACACACDWSYVCFIGISKFANTGGFIVGWSSFCCSLTNGSGLNIIYLLGSAEGGYWFF